jgi:hypothetical protein
MSGDKALAVSLKVKPVSPLLFIGGKGMPENIYLRLGLVERGSPDMYLVTT